MKKNDSNYISPEQAAYNEERIKQIQEEDEAEIAKMAARVAGSKSGTSHLPVDDRGWPILPSQMQHTVGTPQSTVGRSPPPQPLRKERKKRKYTERKSFKRHVLMAYPDAICITDIPYNEQSRYECQFTVIDKITKKPLHEKTFPSALYAWRAAYFAISGLKEGYSPTGNLQIVWQNFYSDYTTDGGCYQTKEAADIAYHNGLRKDRIARKQVRFYWGGLAFEE